MRASKHIHQLVTLSFPHTRQILAVIGIMGLALVVCCALVASAELKEQKVVLYGLGSGEEQEGANGIVTAFETFKDQEEVVEAAVSCPWLVVVYRPFLCVSSTAIVSLWHKHDGAP
jgi:hypothetical protein